MREKIPKNLKTPLLLVGMLCIAMICVAMSGCVYTNGKGETIPIISINLGSSPTVEPTLTRIDTPVGTPIPIQTQSRVPTNPPTTQPTPIRTIATPYPTIEEVRPIVISSTGRSGWSKYSNYADGFHIYKPYDWSATVMPKSMVTTEPIIMDEFVYIYSPSQKGFIMIYGADSTGTVGAIYSDTGRTKISNTLYDTFIYGVKSGFTPDNPLKLIEVVKDSNYYTINGNPARKMMLETSANGESLNGDFYLIAHENSYYVGGYMGMYGSSASDAVTATDIMNTFTVD